MVLATATIGRPSRRAPRTRAAVSGTRSIVPPGLSTSSTIAVTLRSSAAERNAARNRSRDVNADETSRTAEARGTIDPASRSTATEPRRSGGDGSPIGGSA